MKTYLHDTHTVLRALVDTQELSKKAAAVLRSAKYPVFVRAVTFWEVALQYSRGKLVLFGVTPDDLPEMTSEIGLEMLPLSPEDAAFRYRLIRRKHGDPFDRMLAWQAIRNGHVLVTRDRALGGYEDLGLTCFW